MTRAPATSDLAKKLIAKPAKAKHNSSRLPTRRPGVPLEAITRLCLGEGARMYTVVSSGRLRMRRIARVTSLLVVVTLMGSSFAQGQMESIIYNRSEERRVGTEC